MEVAGGPREYHYYNLLNSICWRALEVTEGSWKTGRSFQIYMNLDQITPLSWVEDGHNSATTTSASSNT